MSDKDMEAKIEPKKKILEIFKDFMTGITKLEELGNAGNQFLIGFQQGLGLLQRPPIDSSESIQKINEKNKRIPNSYINAGCFTTHDVSQSIETLHRCMLGLNEHLIKAKSLLVELDCLVEDATVAIETATKFHAQFDSESCDWLHRETTEELNTSHPEEPEVTDYGVLIAIIYTMVKQNYEMQEKIVKSLGLNSSSDELESYTFMWTLRPYVDEEIMNQAWKLIP